MTIFDNRKAIWQWEFSQQAEKSYPAAGITALTVAGADILIAKVMDGTDWQSLYDPGNVGSVLEFEIARTALQIAGVTLVPWVVPHGQNYVAEGTAHAALGPTLMVDIEPYAGFWAGEVAAIPTYLQTLRAGGVTELHVTLDPRATATAALNLAAWAGLVDGLHPQCYWTGFWTPALDVVPLIAALTRPLGPGVKPALPGDGAAADLAAVWSAAQQLGCNGVSVWRLGSMNTTQLAAFAGLTMPALPAQEGDMTPDQVNAAIAAAIAPLQAQVDRLNAVLSKRFDLVRAALDPANPPA